MRGGPALALPTPVRSHSTRRRNGGQPFLSTAQAAAAHRWCRTSEKFRRSAESATDQPPTAVATPSGANLMVGVRRSPVVNRALRAGL